MSQQQNPKASCTTLFDGSPTRVTSTGPLRSYIRYAALGDSVTFGLGDQTSDGCRGWAHLLASAIAMEHDVSLCNTARVGATAADVRHEQLEDALAHRPHIASLVVGLNDTMRSSWDPEKIHADLLLCAQQLAEQGAVLLTVRFHDHTRLLGLPLPGAADARPHRDPQ